ncbi:uncharacterized protein BP5553_07357 [Venustampulla echinocandica]|uniref:Aconitase A/isopropylmalate dehydratase small subunit swivel domain-containing protein n=1 Tax=Venustampulla echinocandica TaxID=2656787 RepID=A0A370TJA2_9HELO|nr:uncharacterized protein BP5553_07357 [Venustampulla echinocandica]RDL35426.1 hypothetical protein BP5553_07357 [Venustampulla echinocandica]
MRPTASILGNISVEKIAEVCMENYDKSFGSIAKAGDILVAGFNFGCGSSREQASTAIKAKKIPLVVYQQRFDGRGSPSSRSKIEGNIFLGRSRGKTDVKKAQENRQSLDSPPPATQASPPEEEVMARRTGWKPVWDLRRSKISVTEGEGGPTWSQKVDVTSALINTAIIGSYTKLNTIKVVGGILAPGTFNGTKVDIAPYLNGSHVSTNTSDNVRRFVNFLDDDGDVTTLLLKNNATADMNSKQYFLLTHLYKFFGALLEYP